MEKVTENFSNSQNNIKKILVGSSIAIAITLISLIVFSCLMTYTSIQENTIPTVVIIITAISILIGSTISTTNLRKNGIINGSTVGLIYIMFIYLLSSILEKNFSLNMQSMIMIIASIFAGAIGGIIGVNKNIKK